MELIAISEGERTRIIKQGDVYIFQEYWVPRWQDIDRTQHEWLASKWILDKGLTVCADYPTIAEIRSKQKETDHENE